MKKIQFTETVLRDAQQSLIDLKTPFRTYRPHHKHDQSDSAQEVLGVLARQEKEIHGEHEKAHRE